MVISVLTNHKGMWSKYQQFSQNDLLHLYFFSIYLTTLPEYIVTIFHDRLWP